MKRKNMIIAVVIVLVVVIGVYAYISANTASTKIEVTSNSTLKNGDSLSFVLKDNYRNVYPNQVIDVKVLDDSGWANNFNATTDENGEAHVQLSALENGNYTVHAQFKGNLFMTSSKSVTNLEINDGYASY